MGSTGAESVLKFALHFFNAPCCWSFCLDDPTHPWQGNFCNRAQRTVGGHGRLQPRQQCRVLSLSRGNTRALDDAAPFHGRGRGHPVLVKSGVTFLKSALYPARLRVNVCLGEHSARSISLRHEIRDADHPDICYTEGYAKLVWVDIGTGKSVALPAEVLALFA
jgi:acyl-CoA thioesterase FadM